MSQPAPEINKPLAATAARGMFLMGGVSIFSKFIGTIASVFLGWYLTKRDYGVVGTAFAITGFVAILKDAGLQQVLVQRQAHFRRWAMPVFWISVAGGLVSAAILLLIIPVAVVLWKDNSLTGALVILAIGTIVNSLATLPSALAGNSFLFRSQAISTTIQVTVSSLLSVVMAIRGWGAYSVIVPWFLATAIRCVSLWYMAPYKIQFRTHFRRWKFLYEAGALIMTSALFASCIAQGDYLTIGLMKNKESVGVFYFAFNLSTQAMALLIPNLGLVLFPAFSKLTGEPNRQMDAFVRASSAFAVVAIPMCFLQAALSSSGLEMVWGDKWTSANYVLAILSIAMGIRIITVPAQALAAAQARYRFDLAFTVAAAIGFLLGVGLAARYASLEWVAWVELAYYGISSPLYVYYLLRANNRGFRDLSQIALGQVLASALALGSSLWVQFLMPGGTRIHATSRFGVGLLAFAVSYWLCAELIAPKPLADAISSIKALRAKKSPGVIQAAPVAV